MKPNGMDRLDGLDAGFWNAVFQPCQQSWFCTQIRRPKFALLQHYCRAFTTTELLNLIVKDETRANRLVELTPNGRYFTMGSLVKIAEEAQNVWLLFSKV
jgi:hypothetical protein